MAENSSGPRVALTPHAHWQRDQQRRQLTAQHFDVLVIGGGATGAGVMLDVLSRGLSCALIDKQDFSAGTSSRSTKLVHGGVRYLEQAIKQFDLSKYQLVREALAERKRMMAMAPHLAWPMNLVTPIKSTLGIPYFRFGLGLYDLLSGDQQLGPSRIESKAILQQLCPDLNIDQLAGGVSYFDGQFDDARFNVAMVRTALEQGGVALNYCAVDDLQQTDGLVSGAHCHDRLSNERFSINAKAVINCAGPWTDTIRKMAKPDCATMMTTSTGAHLVVKRNLLPAGRGILIPKTDDGRVLFMLPWLGKTLIGTTDDGCELTDNPEVTETEINYILKTLNGWLSEPISRADVCATWSGLRPLVADPKAQSTATLTRDHVVLTDNGLTTLTGGKWTTWRKMAQDCVDQVVQTHQLSAGPCATFDLHLVGARGDTYAAKHALAHLPTDIGEHLWQAYGDRAHHVLSQGSERRLIAGEPYIEAELDWALNFEGACTADDVLQRRLRIGMLDERVASQLAEQIQQRLTPADVAV